MAFENEDRVSLVVGSLSQRNRRLHILVSLSTLTSSAVGFMAWAPPDGADAGAGRGLHFRCHGRRDLSARDQRMNAPLTHRMDLS